MAQPKDDIFNDENRLESGRIQWGKIGDHIKGTYTDKKEITYDDGKVGYVYEVLADAGEYHTVTDDESGNAVVATAPTKIEAGSYVRVAGKKGVDDEMKKVKIGQKVGLRFESMGKKVPGKKPFKDVKVYRGAMDEAWLKANVQTPDIMKMDETPFN